MKKITLGRQTLYNTVWSTPMSQLAKKYNISDVGLRKICNKMDIPLPASGHWQKIKYGKDVVVKKLPPNYSCKQEVTLSLRGEGVKGNISQLNPLSVLANEILNTPGLSLKVPSKLSNPVKEVIVAKESLLSKKHHRGYYVGVVNTDLGELDIRVSPKNTGRALRFMDTLIKLLRVRGHDIRVEYENTFAIIENEQIKISLKEKLKRVNVERHSSRNYTKLHANGLLAFKAGRYYPVKEWKDGKILIESRLHQILAWIELQAQKQKEERLAQEEHAKKLAEQRRIEQEFQERRENEIAKFRDLFNQADRWQQTEFLRSYLNKFESDAIEHSTLTKEIENWLIWARKKVDWFDPLINSVDELLNDSDKEKIIAKPESASKRNPW